MARRKPTELLILNGAFEKNPKRKRGIGAKSQQPISEPPATLNDEERENLAGNCFPCTGRRPNRP
jgi:hypothetical protein